MATLASWDSGTLPTTFGTTVAGSSGGGPGGSDAIEVA